MYFESVSLSDLSAVSSGESLNSFVLEVLRCSIP